MWNIRDSRAMSGSRCLALHAFEEALMLDEFMFIGMCRLMHAGMLPQWPAKAFGIQLSFCPQGRLCAHSFTMN